MEWNMHRSINCGYWRGDRRHVSLLNKMCFSKKCSFPSLPPFTYCMFVTQFISINLALSKRIWTPIDRVLLPAAGKGAASSDEVGCCPDADADADAVAASSSSKGGSSSSKGAAASACRWQRSDVHYECETDVVVVLLKWSFNTCLPDGICWNTEKP